MATHHYTDKTYYYYDATLTQDLLTKYINTLSSSTATKTDMTYLGNIATMSHFTGSRHEPNPEVTSDEVEDSATWLGGSHAPHVLKLYLRFTEPRLQHGQIPRFDVTNRI